MEKLLFTSESVTEGHPDKMCDAISDAILDAQIEQDPMSRVACETATTTGLVLVMGEITTNGYVDIQKIVRDTVREIGYTRGKYGFDADTCAVITLLTSSLQILPLALTRLWKQKWARMRSMPLVQGIRVSSSDMLPMKLRNICRMPSIWLTSLHVSLPRSVRTEP